jgi:hypothetical protein
MKVGRLCAALLAEWTLTAGFLVIGVRSGPRRFYQASFGMNAAGRHVERIFPGDGAMSATMRSYDWSVTPLGRPDRWSPALKMMVGIVLSSGQPMFLASGPDRTWLYNDAFTPILGKKHPSALGQPSMEVWAEARDVLEPLFDQVFAGRAVHILCSIEEVDWKRLILLFPTRPHEKKMATSRVCLGPA